MKVEIDQSGKIEKTSRHTYLAFSNHEHFVVKISSTEKRKLQRYFRTIGKSRLFVYITFAALITLILKKLKSKSCQIIIDVEYPGRNNQIKHFIKTFSPMLLADDISFCRIGKKSRAHFLAYGTAIRKLRPDLVVNADQILMIIKKSGST